MAGPLTDGLGWVVIGLFGLAALLEARSRREDAARVAVAGWAVFAVFWLLLVPHFAIDKRSIIEGALSLAAVPACLYTGLKLYRGRTSLLLLSRAVAVMGLVYLPATSVEAVRRPLVLTVTGQVEAAMGLLGYQPEIVEGSILGYQSGFRFVTDGHPYITEVVLACTGIGSISIFVGLLAVVEAPRKRKLTAAAVVVPVIYVLNVARVTFIALAHGNQWFRGHQWVLVLFGASDPNLASYLVADRVISQGLSLVVLVVLALLLVRLVPEVVVVFEDVLYLATGTEHDLRGAVGTDVRLDGGTRDGPTGAGDDATGTVEPSSDSGPDDGGGNGGRED